MGIAPHPQLLRVLPTPLETIGTSVSIYQTDVTSFSQLSIKYKSFENEPNPPNPEPNQIEGKNHL